MTQALNHIRNGGFAREWSQEERKGFPKFNALIRNARRHPINVAEKRIAKLVDFGASLG